MDHFLDVLLMHFIHLRYDAANEHIFIKALVVLHNKVLTSAAIFEKQFPSRHFCSSTRSRLTDSGVQRTLKLRWNRKSMSAAVLSAAWIHWVKMIHLSIHWYPPGPNYHCYALKEPRTHWSAQERQDIQGDRWVSLRTKMERLKLFRNSWIIPNVSIFFIYVSFVPLQQCYELSISILQSEMCMSKYI